MLLRRPDGGKKLSAALFSLPNRLFQQSPVPEMDAVKIAERDGKKTATCDFIACMSDRYALALYSELFMPISWSHI